MEIVESAEGVKTKVLKNSLLLLKEVFSAGQNVHILDEIIEKFVPLLLQKCIDEQKII